MKATIRHTLDLKTAKKALTYALDSYAKSHAEYKPKCAWPSRVQANISFIVKGVKLAGSVRLVKGAVTLELKVPFVFRPFQKRALKIIKKEIQEWLDKATSGELRTA